MYHDLVEDSDTSASGFVGAAADRYKQTPTNFEAHLDAIERRCAVNAQAVSVDTALSTTADSTPWLLTFDDGGVSAVDVAVRLERRNGVGHFFVTTEHVGTTGFLNEQQLCDLHAAGHIIGSHSHTHPVPISALTDEELFQEWQRSVGSLTRILGTPVTVGSVPGGYYSERVARTAAEAGIRTLFTSEPVSQIETVGDCTVLGRFTILRRTPARVAAAFAAGDLLACMQHRTAWECKKVSKRILGRHYIRSTRQWHESLKSGSLAATLTDRSR